MSIHDRPLSPPPVEDLPPSAKLRAAVIAHADAVVASRQSDADLLTAQHEAQRSPAVDVEALSAARRAGRPDPKPAAAAEAQAKLLVAQRSAAADALTVSTTRDELLGVVTAERSELVAAVDGKEAEERAQLRAACSDIGRRLAELDRTRRVRGWLDRPEKGARRVPLADAERALGELLGALQPRPAVLTGPVAA